MILNPPLDSFSHTHASDHAERQNLYRELLTVTCGIDLIGVILIIAGLVKWSYFPSPHLLETLFLGACVFFSAGVALWALGNRNTEFEKLTEV